MSTTTIEVPAVARQTALRAAVAQPSNAPIRKVLFGTAGAGIGTAVGLVLVWLLNTFALGPDQQLDAKIEGVLTTVAAVLVTLAMAWTAAPARAEQVVLRDGTALSARS